MSEETINPIAPIPGQTQQPLNPSGGMVEEQRPDESGNLPRVRYDVFPGQKGYMLENLYDGDVQGKNYFFAPVGLTGSWFVPQGGYAENGYQVHDEIKARRNQYGDVEYVRREIWVHPEAENIGIQTDAAGNPILIRVKEGKQINQGFDVLTAEQLKEAGFDPSDFTQRMLQRDERTEEEKDAEAAADAAMLAAQEDAREAAEAKALADLETSEAANASDVEETDLDEEDDDFEGGGPDENDDDF